LHAKCWILNKQRLHLLKNWLNQVEKQVGRILMNIRPTIDYLGWIPELVSVRRSFKNAQSSIEIKHQLQAGCLVPWKSSLYAPGQEALTLTSEHSNAPSMIRIAKNAHFC